MNNLYKNIDNMIKNESKSHDMYKVIFTTSDGKDIEYEILLTFKSKSNKKIYYIMTDNTFSDNKLNITAFYIKYDENNINLDDETFYPVTDDDELKMTFDVFNKCKAIFRGNNSE